MKQAQLLSIALALAVTSPTLHAAGEEGHFHDHPRGHGQQHAKAAGHGAAIGKPGQAKAGQRTVEVKMTDDMRFVPAEISVRKGETIRLRVTNAGQVKHELVLGKLAALREHAEMMRKFPDMEHDDPNAVSVAPGQTGELVWQFTRGGKVEFGCLQPGHFEAGMKGQVTVAPQGKTAPMAAASAN